MSPSRPDCRDPAPGPPAPRAGRFHVRPEGRAVGGRSTISRLHRTVALAHPPPFLSPASTPKARSNGLNVRLPLLGAHTINVALAKGPGWSSGQPSTPPGGTSPDAGSAHRFGWCDLGALAAVAAAAEDRVLVDGEAERPAARAGERMVGAQGVAAAGRIGEVCWSSPAWAPVAVDGAVVGDGLGSCSPVAVVRVPAHRCSLREAPAATSRRSRRRSRRRQGQAPPQYWPPHAGHCSRQQPRMCSSPSRQAQSRQRSGQASWTIRSAP